MIHIRANTSYLDKVLISQQNSWMYHDIVGPVVHKVCWGITWPLCIEENSAGLFCKLLVFLTSRSNTLVCLFWSNSCSHGYVHRNSTTRSLQNCILFMLIKDELLMAQVKGVYIVATIGLAWVPPSLLLLFF